MTIYYKEGTMSIRKELHQ